MTHPNKLKNLVPNQFKKGQSGNPRGRPRGFSLIVKEQCWERMNELLEIVWLTAEEDIPVLMKKIKLSKGQKYILRGLTDRSEGHKIMFSLLDRVLGRPSVSVSLEDQYKNQVGNMSIEDIFSKLKEYGYEIKDGK